MMLEFCILDASSFHHQVVSKPAPYSWHLSHVGRLERDLIFPWTSVRCQTNTRILQNSQQ
jgi:hypothetical protein